MSWKKRVVCQNTIYIFSIGVLAVLFGFFVFSAGLAYALLEVQEDERKEEVWLGTSALTAGTLWAACRRWAGCNKLDRFYQVM